MECFIQEWMSTRCTFKTLIGMRVHCILVCSSASVGGITITHRPFDLPPSAASTRQPSAIFSIPAFIQARVTELTDVDRPRLVFRAKIDLNERVVGHLP
jgi:hypothetical protein